MYSCIELKYIFPLVTFFFFLMKTITQILKVLEYKEIEFGAKLLLTLLLEES